MNIHTLSLFPELIKNALTQGVIKKAIQNKLLRLNYYDLRDFGIGKYKQVDDTIYGGGAGMVLKPEPIFQGVNKIKSDNLLDNCPVILMSPQGKILDQKKAKNLSKFNGVTMLGGVTMNGEALYSQAQEEINTLEDQGRLTYEEPLMFDIG